MLLILFTGMFMFLKLKGQPNYSLNSIDITEGKSAKISNKAAKKSFKKGTYNDGLVHTTQALQKAENKKQVSKAQNFNKPLHQHNQQKFTKNNCFTKEINLVFQ